MWCPFFSGQDNLLSGQFWAVGRLNLLGGQINLLGGKMPTQLTCYLPPCHIGQKAVVTALLSMKVLWDIQEDDPNNAFLTPPKKKCEKEQM